jgi:hypothetical protein
MGEFGAADVYQEEISSPLLSHYSKAPQQPHKKEQLIT